MAEKATIYKVESLTWSARLDEADDLCKAGFGDTVTTARAQLTHGHVSMLRMWIAGYVQDARTAIARFDLAISTAENGIKSLTSIQKTRGKLTDLQAFDLEDYRLVVAEGTMFKAAMQLYAGDTMKGMINFRSAFKLYENELKRVTAEYKDAAVDWRPSSSQLPEPQKTSDVERRVCFEEGKREFVGFSSGWRFGLGFYMLYISMVPVKLLRILELVGFVVDRELGFGLLAQAVAEMQDEDISRVPVTGYFAVHAILWFLFDFSVSSFTPSEMARKERIALGERILDTVESLCPDSIVWGWLRFWALRQQGRLVEGNEIIFQSFAKYEEQNKNPAPLCESRIASDLQVNLLVSMSYESARKISQETIQSSDPSKSLPLYAFATLGVSELVLGMKREAEATLSKASKYNPTRHLGEVEAMISIKLKIFPNRVHPWVAFGELVLSVFGTEWIHADDALTIANHLLDAIGPLESDRRKIAMQRPSRGSRTLAMMRKVPLTSTLSGDSSTDELSAAYVACASLLRVAGGADASLLPKAVEYAKQAVEDRQADKWVLVFATFELAVLHKLQGDKAKAKQYIEQSRTHVKGFTMERNMGNRIERFRFGI
mmetsp:Transcript_14025/g.56470  ORF Transcript_14025/g.56470 Transcript_14025/m.56470 type:complete len:603 (-) Transcript_14025:1113-2921(-)|eukprot:CAMPEP_0113963552 /NCGR_PEP_ID=MMETSP0011_2-20120614/6581_1 /TAXON_ID=101924 /ORGANISM="Rhodosorus marinus" /LENGTH=602 /DNA_ID=CAMNT_0000975623 /DNA_START=474 /DNA_END=2282 /DNA_ORIENTATION=- /assembly_acc=CAM_ASM_000156